MRKSLSDLPQGFYHKEEYPGLPEQLMIVLQMIMTYLLNMFAIASILSDGMFVMMPVSYLYIFCFVVPIISASSVCVSFLSVLNFLIILPIPIFTTILYIQYITNRVTFQEKFFCFSYKNDLTSYKTDDILLVS